MTERAAWLKTERTRRKMPQKKLAAMASVSIRTLQRAEEGRRVSDGVWRDFEAALGSSPTLARRSERKTDRYRQFRQLKRAQFARDFFEALGQAAVVKMDCDVEPTANVFPVLKRAIGFLEERLPNPWNSDRRRYRPATLLQRVEDEATLNELMDELHGIGAGVYYELQWGHLRYPQADWQGSLHVMEGQEPEGGFLLHVVISASDKDRESFPEVLDWGIETVEDPFENDEVPF